MKNATFRICSDNPKILSSWIITLFYFSWHDAQGVKSCLATQGHGERNLPASSASFHLLPTSRQVQKLIVLRDDIKHTQLWICHWAHTNVLRILKQHDHHSGITTLRPNVTARLESPALRSKVLEKNWTETIVFLWPTLNSNYGISFPPFLITLEH